MLKWLCSQCTVNPRVLVYSGMFRIGTGFLFEFLVFDRRGMGFAYSQLVECVPGHALQFDKFDPKPCDIWVRRLLASVPLAFRQLASERDSRLLACRTSIASSSLQVSCTAHRHCSLQYPRNGRRLSGTTSVFFWADHSTKQVGLTCQLRTCTCCCNPGYNLASELALAFDSIDLSEQYDLDALCSTWAHLSCPSISEQLLARISCWRLIPSSIWILRHSGVETFCCVVKCRTSVFDAPWDFFARGIPV